MDSVIRGVTENYGDRVRRITLFDPLYALDRKNTTDNSNRKIDFFGLGLLTLLFFFENMLIRNKKTGVSELAEFLYEINKDEIDLQYKGFEKLARTIIEVFRPPSGRRNLRSFYNWEVRKEESIHYSILKASKSDLKTNTQYYTLDEQGLELIFATKEYFSEFQLSINQLLLRKQLEKGEFVGALRQIDEMRIDVETLGDRIKRIKHEVQRNILSEKTYGRYKELIDDIKLRLNRENNEFDELQTFVDETKEKLSYELKNDKDIKTYEYIIKIQRELGEVHDFHKKLLTKSIELKTVTLESAHESLYYIGVESFNFKKEIVSRMLSSPLPLKATRQLLKPFLYLQKQQAWSPITVFAPQRIENRENEVRINEFPDMKDEERTAKEVELQQENFKFIMEIVLRLIDQKGSTTIQKIVNYMNENDYSYILEDVLFYHFFIIIHQKSPIVINKESMDKEVLLEKVLELLLNKYHKVVVNEKNEIVKGSERFSIKNMSIKVEEIENVI